MNCTLKDVNKSSIAESQMTINHALPSPSGFAIVAQPGMGEPIGDRVRKGTKDDPFKDIIIKCPKTGIEYNAEIHDIWRFTINDEQEANLITAMSKLAYAITGPQLINVMRKRYPNMTNQIEFLLLKLK